MGPSLQSTLATVIGLLALALGLGLSVALIIWAIIEHEEKKGRGRQ